MSEYRWTYYDPSQGTQTLGIYHGNETGHIMIYHNEKVVIIDFRVHSSKSYSFLFNKNLLKLSVTKKDGEFVYIFEGTRLDGHKPSWIIKIRDFIIKPFTS